MTFEEIGRKEHISPTEAEVLFERGMRKLKRGLSGRLIVEGLNLLHDLDNRNPEYSIAR